VNQPDRYGDWDAAYVLGALTVQQRHEYEDHLAGCAECRRSVGELAAMPGLLAQLPAAEAIALSDQTTTPVPDSIRNLTPPRGLGTRARLLLVAAVVAALIVGGLGGFLARGVIETRPGRSTSELVAFAPDHQIGMIANAKLTSSGARTKIAVDCMYALQGGSYGHQAEFALETVDDQGNRQRSWTWAAGPGDHKQWQGWSATPLRRITELQIVYADSGSPVMTAEIH
jgi:hypothetical protein